MFNCSICRAIPLSLIQLDPKFSYCKKFHDSVRCLKDKKKCGDWRSFELPPHPDDLYSAATARTNRMQWNPKMQKKKRLKAPQRKYVFAPQNRRIGLKDTKIRGEEKIDCFYSNIVNRLNTWIREIQKPIELHPFDRSVFNLTWDGGEEQFNKNLQSIDSFCNKIRSAKQKVFAQLRKAGNIDQAHSITADGIEELSDVFEYNAYDLLHPIRDQMKSIRDLQSIDPHKAAVVLIGSPNVGKSSIVRAISSGVPIVHNYPFTTRRFIVGHFLAKVPLDDGERWVKLQVTDTPGLLNRPDKDRNKMELLTTSFLKHVPHSLVVFVLDPTGHCGRQIEEQLTIRDTIIQKYPNCHLIDILAKQDLNDKNGWPWDKQCVLQLYEESVRPTTPICISTEEDYGFFELTQEMRIYAKEYIKKRNNSGYPQYNIKKKKQQQ